jgi:hypothetical protein
VYDSIYNTVDDATNQLLRKFFGGAVQFKLPSVQRQYGSKDCGLFALAVCTAIVHGVDPSKIQFNQPQMRPHLIACYENNNLLLFPVCS